MQRPACSPVRKLDVELLASLAPPSPSVRLFAAGISAGSRPPALVCVATNHPWPQAPPPRLLKPSSLSRWCDQLSPANDALVFAEAECPDRFECDSSVGEIPVLKLLVGLLRSLSRLLVPY